MVPNSLCGAINGRRRRAFVIRFPSCAGKEQNPYPHAAVGERKTEAGRWGFSPAPLLPFLLHLVLSNPREPAIPFVAALLRLSFTIILLFPRYVLFSNPWLELLKLLVLGASAVNFWVGIDNFEVKNQLLGYGNVVSQLWYLIPADLRKKLMW